MIEQKIRVTISNSPFMQVKDIEFMEVRLPARIMRLVATGNDSPTLLLEIGATHFEIVDETEKEIAEESEVEQPENDNF